MSNRLASETSPYLLQHKDNPVDWYPWGPEALERARAEDKPILLSVGYAACHWCHVMEHESFEDADTAALMNEHFVPIKVDREERPDIDAIYMEAVQRLTGHGGWPMTMFLTPEGAPFEGGTYFPKEERHGLPSFRRVLSEIARIWREHREAVEEQARRLVAEADVSTQLRPSEAPLEEDVLDQAVQRLNAQFDHARGGFGAQMKFPQPMTLDFLMRLAARGHDAALQMAARTLDAMAAGGIFDQLGGGFHRYSVDPEWLVPHFEKMLYDNAQLLRTYARSWAMSGNPRHREVAEDTVEWMLREMRDAGGGLWSSLDADSEGVEGKFYVWSLDEVREVTGDDFEVAEQRWGFTRNGNFEGHNIPVFGRDPDDDDAVRRARSALMERRATRVRPAADTKVLTAWNALAASALAEAGMTLGHHEWVETASEIMTFVLDKLRIDGRLMRSYRGDDEGRGTVKHLAYCEDYAFVLEASLSLFEATADPAWLEEARWAADEAIRLFADDGAGFFSTGSDAEPLVTRPKDLVDNAIPSANSVLALELQRLADLTGEAAYEERSVAIMKLLREAMVRSPTGFGHLLSAVDLYVTGAREIVIVEGDGEAADGMLEVARSRYIPNRILVVVTPANRHALEQLPLVQGRTSQEGKTTAYVCHRGSCRLPVTNEHDLVRELAG